MFRLHYTTPFSLQWQIFKKKFFWRLWNLCTWNGTLKVTVTSCSITALLISCVGARVIGSRLDDWGSKPCNSNKFFSPLNRPEGPRCPPFLLFNIYGLIARGQSGGEVKLNTYFFLVPNLRISGVYLYSPICFHGVNMETAFYSKGTAVP
jgi:hypothetical protein